MTPSFQNASHIINKHLPDVTTRGPVLAAAVGFAMSRLAQLPSAPVEDAGNFYNMTVSDAVRTRISTINEQIIINVNDALQWSRAFWNVRYATVHQPRVWIPADDSQCFFNSFSQADQYLSRQQLELLNGKTAAIFDIANDLICTVGE